LIQLEPLAAPRAEALVGEADAERRVVAPDMAAVRAGDDEAIARGPARPPPPDHLHEAGPAGMPPDERQRLDRIRPLGLGQLNPLVEQIHVVRIHHAHGAPPPPLPRPTRGRRARHGPGSCRSPLAWSTAATI